MTEIGTLFKVIGGKVKNPNWPVANKSIPFYDNPSGKTFIYPGEVIMFLARERNTHWPDHEWYWWRIYSFANNEIGYIGEDEALEELK